MKRKVKHSSKLYSFLEKEGVLNTEDEELIKNAKKKYWSSYRSAWKKTKRHETKSFEILLNANELKVISNEAKRCNTSQTNYIKQSALTTKTLVDPVAMGEIRELLHMHFNTIQNLADENSIYTDSANHMLDEVAKIETKIFGFFKSLKFQQ